MIVWNITHKLPKKGISVSIETLIFDSFKDKREDPGIVLPPCAFFDTRQYRPNMTDEQVLKNIEIQIFLKQGKIKVMNEIPEEALDPKFAANNEIQETIARISSTDSPTLLEDIIENADQHPKEVVDAAKHRAFQLTGDSGIDNPETRGARGIPV